MLCKSLCHSLLKASSRLAKSGRIAVKITHGLILQKTKYADLQISPSSGLEILGNTSSTVQYSVVGDTTNMEYSVVGPGTVSSQVSHNARIFIHMVLVRVTKAGM